MLSEEKIKRINELARKAKTESLSTAEAEEQAQLRAAYLEAFRNSMRNTITSLKVIDPDGNDVTPEKVKKYRDEDQLH